MPKTHHVHYDPCHEHDHRCHLSAPRGNHGDDDQPQDSPPSRPHAPISASSPLPADDYYARVRMRSNLGLLIRGFLHPTSFGLPTSLPCVSCAVSIFNLQKRTQSCIACCHNRRLFETWSVKRNLVALGRIRPNQAYQAKKECRVSFHQWRMCELGGKHRRRS